MERQQSSTERASLTSSAQCLNFSRRRSYIPAAVPVSIMSSDVFVQQFLPVFFADSTMNPDLCLEVGEEPLKSVVGVRETGLRMVVESPQKRHITLDAQICASQSGMHVRRCPALDSPRHEPLSLTTSLYLSYHSPNAPMKLSLSVAVIPFTSPSSSLEASISGVLREIPANDEHLVELAHLYAERLQSLWQPFHPVYHHAVYPEPRCFSASQLPPHTGRWFHGGHICATGYCHAGHHGSPSARSPDPSRWYPSERSHLYTLLSYEHNACPPNPGG